MEAGLEMEQQELKLVPYRAKFISNLKSFFFFNVVDSNLTKNYSSAKSICFVIIMVRLQ